MLQSFKPSFGCYQVYFVHNKNSWHVEGVELLFFLRHKVLATIQSVLTKTSVLYSHLQLSISWVSLCLTEPHNSSLNVHAQSPYRINYHYSLVLTGDFTPGLRYQQVAS